MDERITVYVTKYALTQGLFKTEATKTHDHTMIEVKGTGIARIYYHGNDWHLEKEEAIKHCEKLREKEILKLERKIKKLKEKKFFLREE